MRLSELTKPGELENFSASIGVTAIFGHIAVTAIFRHIAVLNCTSMEAIKSASGGMRHENVFSN